MDPTGYGQTPPPPPAPPYGWVVPPAVPKRSNLTRIIGGIGGVLVVAVVALVIFGLIGGNPKDAGKVVFSPDVPTTGNNCRVPNQVTSIASGKSIYASYIFKHKLGSDSALLSATKDGQAWAGPIALPNTNGLNCFLDTSDLSNVPGLPLDPAVYKFTVTVNGETVAEGTLTVTP
jgi:hypothetical protein